MPELPEVETARRDLNRLLKGKRIQKVRILHPALLRGATPEEFRESLEGKRILGAGRRGKYLLLLLEGGAALAVHFKMTGRFFLQEQEKDLPKHTHLVMALEGKTYLCYSDIRKFGRIYLLKGGEEEEPDEIRLLGLDPLGEEFTLEAFRDLTGSRKEIKRLLLDQHLIAGIGNIYVSEILWRAGIRPERPASSLSGDEIAGLFQAIPEVLKTAVASGGSTLRDRTYLRVDGTPGKYQRLHKVYYRTGLPCPVCGEAIEKSLVAKRSSFFCPRCQK